MQGKVLPISAKVPTICSKIMMPNFKMSFIVLTQIVIYIHIHGGKLISLKHIKLPKLKYFPTIKILIVLKIQRFTSAIMYAEQFQIL